MKTLLQNEILEQPQALKRLLEAEQENIHTIARAIERREPRFVVMAARGSSDNAARYGQYLFGARNRMTVALATPSLFTLYQSPPRLTDALVLAISQSGQSPDILAVTEEGRRQGALTLAISNESNSPLASTCEYCINLHAGYERSIAASKTYTSSLLALAMLSLALEKGEEQKDILKMVPDVVFETMRQAEAVISSAENYKEAEACVVIGRGYNYATAFEIALKLKELAYILAEPYSSADFQHGPVALVEGGFLVLSIVPEGKVTRELTGFMRTLLPRKPQLVVVSPVNAALKLAKTSFPIPQGIPEWLSPIVAVVPGQLFALGLALSKGLNPDAPRGLKKVTQTH